VKVLPEVETWPQLYLGRVSIKIQDLSETFHAIALLSLVY